jgi:hypothetical protein
MVNVTKRSPTCRIEDDLVRQGEGLARVVAGDNLQGREAVLEQRAEGVTINGMIINREDLLSPTYRYSTTGYGNQQRSLTSPLTSSYGSGMIWISSNCTRVPCPSVI